MSSRPRPGAHARSSAPLVMKTPRRRNEDGDSTRARGWRPRRSVTNHQGQPHARAAWPMTEPPTRPGGPGTRPSPRTRRRPGCLRCSCGGASPTSARRPRRLRGAGRSCSRQASGRRHSARACSAARHRRAWRSHCRRLGQPSRTPASPRCNSIDGERSPLMVSHREPACFVVVARAGLSTGAPPASAQRTPTRDSRVFWLISRLLFSAGAGRAARIYVHQRLRTLRTIARK